jgi:hypothetical protein
MEEIEWDEPVVKDDEEEVPLEAPEADVAEQRAEVPMSDEDDPERGVT